VDLRHRDQGGHLAPGGRDLGRDLDADGLDRLRAEHLAGRRHEHRQQQHAGHHSAPPVPAHPEQVGHGRGQITEQADQRAAPPRR
jgi:hypothetical protein